MNYDSERSFVGTAVKIQCGNKISIHRAAAVSDAKFNKITARPLPTNCKKKDAKEEKKGIFHLLSKEVHEAIITVAIEDSTVARETNRVDLERVEQAKLEREELT